MKAGVLAVAAAMATGVMGKHARRHNHEAFHLEERNYPISSKAATTTGSGAEETCGCTTIYTTITGEGTLYNPPTYTTMKPKPTSTVVIVPTPFATTCPTPGVYTIPATTLTLTKTTTVCGATSTPVAPGTHTAGGVTTIVKTATTVVCPYATTSTHEGVVTSTILTTTYVCPSAGTYTIAPLTTTVSSSTVWVYPTPATYTPGTYTQPEIVTTITKTNVVVVCPYTSSTPAPPAPTYVASSPPAKPTTSYPTSPGKPGLGSSGGKWAMTYSPYFDNEDCKDADTVDADIAVIKSKGFRAVRVYSTDCTGLEHIGASCEKYGLKMIIGVFINSDGCAAAAPQVTAMINWGRWDLVELIVIGNEALFSGHTSAGELAGFISSSTSAFKAAKYTGPITTTEPLNIWQENAGTLCGVVDVVGCNIHPFFNPSIAAADAGSFVKSQLDLVDGLCPGKPGYNLETGWPSNGTCNGLACPTPYEQATAVAGIQAAAGDKSVMFSYLDDGWKTAGAFDCEKHWGCIHLFPVIN